MHVFYMYLYNQNAFVSSYEKTNSSAGIEHFLKVLTQQTQSDEFTAVGNEAPTESL